MSEAPVSAPQGSERWKNLLVFLTIINTVIVACLAALQADASIRANLADRDSQYFAIGAMGDMFRVGLESDFEFRVVFDVLKNEQESVTMEMAGLELEMTNLPRPSGLNEAAAAAKARAVAGRKFSSLLSDPRFAPKEEIGLPNFQAFLDNTNDQAKRSTERQNAAADEYLRWSSKSDNYLMILTITAVAFLLFGVGQTLRAVNLRLAFAILGGYIELVCVIWAAVILAG